MGPLNSIWSLFYSQALPQVLVNKGLLNVTFRKGIEKYKNHSANKKNLQFNPVFEKFDS